MTTSSTTSGYLMCFNMKWLFAVISMVLVGCANDTGVSADYYDVTTLSSSSYEPYSWMYSSSSKTPEIAKHYFPTDLEYVGIYGAELVMKNNTAYQMSVKVNYTISCSVNGGSVTTSVNTIWFNLDMYEQISEPLRSYWSGTIDCTGTISSIIPAYSDNSNFQTWTGLYPISTKQPQRIR